MKSKKILVPSHCIIYFNVDHRYGECPRKFEVHNLFKTKHVSSNVTTTLKSPNINNVLVNVVVVITTHNQ